MFVINHRDGKSQNFIIIIVVEVQGYLKFLVDFFLKFAVAEHIFQIIVVERIRRIFRHVKFLLGVIVADRIDQHFAVILNRAGIIICAAENRAD